MARSKRRIRASDVGAFLNRRPGRSAGLILPGLLVLVIVLAIGFSLGGGATSKGRKLASSGTPSSTSPGKPLASCGGASQATCTVDPGWIDVPQDTPADVAAAIAGSGGYTRMTTHFGGSALDTPVLVRSFELRPTGVEYYDDDHWIVRLRDSTGRATGVFDYIYDRANHRISLATFGKLTPGDPRATQPFPATSAADAVTRFQSARSIAVKPGQQPEPVYFPIDPAWRVPNSVVHSYSGGGESPFDPMWHVVGADGHDYFVGTDNNVYTVQQLPFAPGKP